MYNKTKIKTDRTQTNMPKELLIIILTYNDFAYTISTVKNCLKLENISFDILVIDNASPSNAVYNNLLNEFKTNPLIKIIKRTVNDGYAGGNNYGICHAKQYGYKFCWILNNDVAFDNYAFVRDNITLLENQKKIALIGHRVLTVYPDGKKIEYKNSSLVHEILNFNKNYLKAPVTINNRYIKKTRISGASMLMNVENIINIGLLNELFFMYGEEDEFCLRTWSHKYRIYIDNQAIIEHFGGMGNINKSNYWRMQLVIRNKIVLIQNFNILKRILSLMVFFASIINASIKDFINGRSYLAKIRLKAFFKYLFILNANRTFDLINDKNRILKKFTNNL